MEGRAARRVDWGIRVAGAMVAYGLVFVLWCAFHWGGTSARTVVVDLAFTPVNLLAAILAWRAARRLAGDPRQRAWLFIAAAFGLWWLGDLNWAVSDLIRHTTPFPSWSDVCYLGFYPLLMAGLLAYPAAALRRGERLKFSLDVATVVVAGAMLVWFVAIGPTTRAPHDSVLSLAVTLAYPVGDMVVILAMVMVMLRGTRRDDRTVLGIVLGAICLFVAADLGYARLSLNVGYQAGSWPDACWMVAQCLMVVAAAVQCQRARLVRHPQSEQHAASGRISRLPYVAMIIGVGLVATVAIQDAHYPLDGLVMGLVVLIVVVMVRQLQADAELRSTVSLLSATLDSTAEGVLVVDAAGNITQFNRRFTQMWRVPEGILSGSDAAAPADFVLDQLSRPDAFVTKVDDLDGQADAITDDTLEFKDGRVFERHSRPQRVNGTIVGRVWSFRDVTDRARLLEQLAHQAFHDDLTGLANRALLRDRLEHALARSRRSAATVAVLFCDLDRFKMTNDTLGHDCGDLLLVEVAARFARSVRDGDTIARLGGDEFAVVLDETTSEDAATMAQRLLDAVREPFVINSREVFVRASIGIADTGADAPDADDLLRRADIAMYAAKERGRDRFETFQPTMQTELAAHHELYGDLRHALQDGELVPYYQPLINLKTHAIESFEALLRWNHPTRGIVGPDEFIPIAEESGLIVDIGRSVLNEACRQVVQWRTTLPGADTLSIGVNVSSHQLYDHQFVTDVEEALRTSGLPPTSLILELTESALLADTAHIHERLDALKRLGVQLAIDDFGTGYSSLSYLRTFPVDFLKIDRSFVNQINQPGSEQGRAMVRSIISIGHDLKLGVIAEGIEETGQLDELRDAGCDTGQGWLFARAVPADQIPALVDRHCRHGRFDSFDAATTAAIR
jgi:diguanylate cyclase (GGDEF)-like protein